jgi:hypothetical protein
MIGWEELLRRLRHNDFLVSRTTRAGGPGEGGPTTLGVLDAPRRHNSLRRLRRPRLTPGSARLGTDHMHLSRVADPSLDQVVVKQQDPSYGAGGHLKRDRQDREQHLAAAE